MPKIICAMQERTFYSLEIEVEQEKLDDPSFDLNAHVATLAEEEFVQGNYRFVGCDDRSLEEWEVVSCPST